MMRFWKKNEKAADILKSLLISYLLTGGMILVLAFLLYKFSLSKSLIGMGIIMIYIVSAFVGGLSIGKSMKVKKYMWGLILGAGYFLVLVIISLVVNKGADGLSDNVLLTFIMCAGSGMLGGMLG